jgi:hypothetical protein
MSSPISTDEAERRERHRPKLMWSEALRSGRELKLSYFAPNESDFNTLHLTLSAEARITNDRGRPLANERCILWLADGTKREARTDGNGVVRFDGLPLLCDLRSPAADIDRPALQLPDVLEEWPAKPIGDFGKDGSYRTRDGMVHFVPVETPKHPLSINRLTEEEKFQHFVSQYVDNGARYWSSNLKKRYDETAHRWTWNHGAVCNEHVNFFLGFWFNYNGGFTKEAIQTGMLCQVMYSSERHNFATNLSHRGYSDFLEPVEGFGTKVRPQSPLPDAKHWNKAWTNIEYIRVGKYLDRTTGNTRNARGAQLLSSLANFNVYSVADIKSKKAASAVSDVRGWLKAHKGKAIGLVQGQSATHVPTDSEIDNVSLVPNDKIWERVDELDDADTDDAKLIKTLKNHVTWDHHCGVLVRRAPGGGPPGAAPPYEWWTFSADGSKNSSNGPLIIMKKFADADLDRRFFHIGIWKLKSLRPGGYSPLEAEANAGGLSIDEPPRHIHWG